MTKRIKKLLLIIITIILLIVMWLFIIRAKLSNDLKSSLFLPWANGQIAKIYTWTWTDISWFTTGWKSVIEIPVYDNNTYTISLKIYNEKWEKWEYITYRDHTNEKISGMVYVFYKDSILWIKEYKMPKWAFSRIDEDVFKLDLKDFHWFSDINGNYQLYKILWKWKTESVYLQIVHWPNVKIELSIIE